jgi:RNA polymerase sigma-70 factor (ECF subfamily)
MDNLTRDLILAQDGDLEAFSRVVRDAQPEIRRFCTWFMGNTRDIDDVVQETLLRMYKGLHSFRGDSRGISWVLTIARRTCVDHARRHNRQQLLVRALEKETLTTHNHGDVSTFYITEAIDSLPELLRESFVLVKIFGCSYSETAAVLRCPVGTVQSRVARARTLLMNSLESAERTA